MIQGLSFINYAGSLVYLACSVGHFLSAILSHGTSQTRQTAYIRAVAKVMFVVLTSAFSCFGNAIA